MQKMLTMFEKSLEVIPAFERGLVTPESGNHSLLWSDPVVNTIGAQKWAKMNRALGLETSFSINIKCSESKCPLSAGLKWKQIGLANFLNVKWFYSYNLLRLTWLFMYYVNNLSKNGR